MSSPIGILKRSPDLDDYHFCCPVCGIIGATYDGPYYPNETDKCADRLCIDCWMDVYASCDHRCPICTQDVSEWIRAYYPIYRPSQCGEDSDSD
jgi:hypothetical protein